MKSAKSVLLAALALLLALAAPLLAAGCERAPPGGGAGAGRSVILATTTSVQDSGLLGALLPAFQRKTGIDVKPVAVGSGEAIEMARRGEADAVLAHSPEDEEALLADGFALERRILMRNSFVIVGPAADPAGVARAASAAQAFRAIAAAAAPFVTRGDRSGTHRRELSLWRKAGVDLAAAGTWYVRASAGMAEALRIADERRAYTLTDDGTLLARRDRLDLAVLFDRRGPDLENVYSVLVLNPARLPRIEAAGGRALADFLAGREGRAIVETFGVSTAGRPLFRAETAR